MSARPQPPHRTTTASGMRRNLFSSNLSRRPTGPSSTSATSATTLQLADEHAEDRDIVARDEEGNYRLEMPNVGPLPRDDAREEREVESRLIETYRKHQQHIEPNGKHHAGSQDKAESTPSVLTDSSELKATLQASLQAKVESLDDDKWMFEGDDPLPS